MRGSAPRLTWLRVGDPSPLWERMGFVVNDDAVHVGEVAITLGGPAGITGWGLDAVAVEALDTVPRPRLVAGPHESAPAHPNGITHIDHLVLRVGDLERTAADLGALGIEIRRSRDAVLGGAPMVQLFAWVGSTILEVVGPGEPTADPARFWGITFVSVDLDRTAGRLGELAGPVRDAVQPGRRIVSLDTRSAGGTVPLAAMTPHRRT